MIYQPNSKGQYRVNFNNLICIAVKVAEDIFSVRNHKGEITEVLSNEITFFDNFKSQNI